MDQRSLLSWRSWYRSFISAFGCFEIADHLRGVVEGVARLRAETEWDVFGSKIGREHWAQVETCSWACKPEQNLLPQGAR